MLAALTRDLLPITGSRPLAGWDVVGTVRRVPSPGGTGGFVMEMKEGSPPSRIEISGLRSRHRYVALEVHTRPGKPFVIEVGVRDDSRLARKLTVSSGCKAPEFARGGGAKAKLPLVTLPPGAAPEDADSIPAAPAGWRLAVLDLDVLVRRAFDGATYASVDSVGVVGVCFVRSVSVCAEPPNPPPPGPVRLVATFGTPHQPPPPPLAPEAPLPTGAAAASALKDPGAHMSPEQAEAAAEAAAVAAAARAVAEARTAEQEFLRLARQKAPPVSEADLGFIPATDRAPAPAAPPPGGLGRARLRAAVRRVGAARAWRGMPHQPTRRHGDPRDHATLLDGSGGGGGGGGGPPPLDGATAGVYTHVRTGGGEVATDDAVAIRSGTRAAQQLSRELRWGCAGEVVSLGGVAIGEAGAQLLSFVLARARTLREVHLARTAVGERGAASLARALRRTTTVRVLDLRASGIGPAGAEQLARALEVGCVGLRTLLLGGNPLGPKGVVALADVLPAHAALGYLDLERTSAAAELRPLFGAGDAVRLVGGRGGAPRRVVHVVSGRCVPCLGGGGGGDEGGGGGEGGGREGGGGEGDGDGDDARSGRLATLLGSGAMARTRPGQTLDLRACARPPLDAALTNVGSNGVVEALMRAVGLRMPAMRAIYLGGNGLGAAGRDDMTRTLAGGPNATQLLLHFHVAADTAAAAAAEMRSAAEARAEAAAALVAQDDAARAGLAKRWHRGGSGRLGTVAPEPSFASVGSAAAVLDGAAEGASALAAAHVGDDGDAPVGDESDGGGGGGGDDDDYCDDESEEEDEVDAQSDTDLVSLVPPGLTLQRSQTMSSVQSGCFALGGGRVAAQAKPPVQT